MMWHKDNTAQYSIVTLYSPNCLICRVFCLCNGAQQLTTYASLSSNTKSPFGITIDEEESSMMLVAIVSRWYLCVQS